MLIEYISYTATFIVSIGMTIIGITSVYYSYQQQRIPALAILLYQQIFLFSFFIYGIWGNMVLHEIIADLELNNEIAGKLAFYVPIIGIPFMIVSWFMLLKFGFNVNGYSFTKGFIYSYFPTLVVVIFTLSFLIQKEILLIPDDADLFVVRIIVLLNFLIHCIFLLSFLFKPRKSNLLKKTGLAKKWIYIYFVGVVIYSSALFYFNIFSFISICISIILLFSISIIIPARIKIYLLSHKHDKPEGNFDFDAFCKYYEISKREAEIILEICSGKSNKAIADKLFITLQTVKDHTHRIYTKTDVKNRVQLANLVMEKTDTKQVL